MHRAVYVGAVWVLLAVGTPAPAGEREAALAIIDRAIAAQGGEQALVKAQTVLRRGTGNMFVFDKPVPFTDETLFHLPGQFRLTVTLGPDNQKTLVLVVVNGAKGWRSTGGAVVELSKDAVDEFREAGYLYWVGSLVPLKKDTNFQLSLLPEIKVQDQPAVGVKVAHKDHESARLYFDKGTGMLVQMGHNIHEAGLQVDKDFILSDYKAFDGVKLPTKQTELTKGKSDQKSKKFIEVSFTSYQFPEKLDDSAFGKP